MKKRHCVIDNIPAIIWGDEANPLFIAVHGKMSSKDDTIIERFANEATQKGCSVLSFDLPEHGDRKNNHDPCSVQNAVRDLKTIYDYAQNNGNPVGIFGCSMGAYFSLLAYSDKPLEKCLFLSPVVDMERIIKNMMQWFEISEEQLQKEQLIETPIGEPLYWEYYDYVKRNPIGAWSKPTAILYGSNDQLCEWEVVKEFASRNNCVLDVMESGEHFFHTDEQLSCFSQWLRKRL